MQCSDLRTFQTAVGIGATPPEQSGPMCPDPRLYGNTGDHLKLCRCSVPAPDSCNARRCANVPYPLLSCQSQRGSRRPRSTMIRSRWTFARIDAAATQKYSRSALFGERTGQPRSPSSTWSVTTVAFGASTVRAAARIASRVASRILSRSMRSTQTSHTTQLGQQARSRSAASSRRRGVKSFESRTP
jgi:hypothetical protein